MSLAARGTRQLGEQVEQIEDAEELAQVRRQARRINLKSFLGGLVITLIIFLLPF